MKMRPNKARMLIALSVASSCALILGAHVHMLLLASGSQTECLVSKKDHAQRYIKRRDDAKKEPGVNSQLSTHSAPHSPTFRAARYAC